MIDILLQYILWYEFLNDLNSQWFWEKILTKKAAQVWPLLS